MTTLDYFRKPGKHLKVFEPTRDKLEILADKLMNTPMYLSDEYRTEPQIAALMQYWFPSGDSEIKPLNIFYEMGDFGGLMGFVNIQPEWRSDLFFKVWDRGIVGPTLARDIKNLIKKFMIEWKLKRLALASPDEKAGKFFGNVCNFRTEGTLKYGFMFHGKPTTLFMYRRILEPRKEI